MVKLYKYIGSVDNYGAYQDIFVAQRLPGIEIINGQETHPWRHMRKFVQGLMVQGTTFTGLNPNWTLFLKYMQTIPNECRDFYNDYVIGTENIWYSTLFTDCKQLKKKFNQYEIPTGTHGMDIDLIQEIPYKIYYIGVQIRQPEPEFDYGNKVYFDLFLRNLGANRDYELRYLLKTVKSNLVRTGNPGNYTFSQELFQLSQLEYPDNKVLYCMVRNFSCKNKIFDDWLDIDWTEE